MGATPAEFPKAFPDAPGTTAELLAALPEGLMLADGAVPADRRMSDVLSLYRAVFLNATEAIAIVDAQGRYLEQNVAHEMLLGYSSDELHGRTPAIHLGDDTFTAIVAELQTYGMSRREVLSRTKGGDTRALELSSFAVRNATGHATCFVGITRDVTEQHRAAAALTRRFEELQAVYRMSEALARAVGLDDIFDEAIDGMVRALRVDRASILLFDDDDVMRFKAWRGLSDGYRAAVEGHSPWSRDTRDPEPVAVADVAHDPAFATLAPVITAEGIAALAFVPLVERPGGLQGKFMLYFDAPHVWSAEELRLATTIARHVAFAITRHQREAELREANRAKSVFLATMSHELRTPLNAIAGYTDLLDAGVHGGLSHAQAQAVSRIQANQQHLLRLIDDVLDFAKIEAGHLRFDVADVPVQETIDGTRVFVEPQLRAKDVAFAYESGDPHVTCRADRAKMQQVVINLLSNAWKFTPRGGRVTLAWRASEEWVDVSVTDTGSGIPAEKLEAVFAPFVQLQSGFRRRVEGTGLGLAISRELARGMGGDVMVESRVGVGSIFTLRLPRRTT